jgi:hypothetical protein
MVYASDIFLCQDVASNLLTLPLLNLRLVDVPQLVHAGRLACGNALRQLHEAANRGPLRDGVLNSLGLDPDDANAGVLGATIVLAVTEVANPCLQSGRVVLADNLTVCLDACVARDGCPLARGVDEANVDGRLVLDVVGLARLGVGVEEEVKAVSLLQTC